MSPSSWVRSDGCGGRELGKGQANDVKAFLELVIWNGQRHQRPDHVVVNAGAEQDQPFFARDGEELRSLGISWGLRFAIAHQLHARHGAHDADVAYKLVL